MAYRIGMPLNTGKQKRFSLSPLARARIKIPGSCVDVQVLPVLALTLLLSIALVMALILSHTGTSKVYCSNVKLPV